MTLARGPLERIESGFVGQIYEFVIRRPVLGVAQLLCRLDSLVVDSSIVGLGRSTATLSQSLKRAVSGNAQHYGLVMAAGILAIMVLVIVAK